MPLDRAIYLIRNHVVCRLGRSLSVGAYPRMQRKEASIPGPEPSSTITYWNLGLVGSCGMQLASPAKCDSCCADNYVQSRDVVSDGLALAS